MDKVHVTVQYIPVVVSSLGLHLIGDCLAISTGVSEEVMRTQTHIEMYDMV